MERDEDEADESVSVSMELTGEFDDIMSKLDSSSTGERDLAPLVDDVDRVLDVVDRIGGGTRSTIAESLSGESTVEYDAEGIVPVLQVLERYGLVTLDGNTWYPGERTE